MYDGDVPSIELSMTDVDFALGTDWETGNVIHDGIVYSENCMKFIKGTVWARNSSLLNYLGDDTNAYIETNMEDLAEPVKITANNVTIHLNDNDITSLSSDVFEVTGSLTINGSDDAKVTAGTNTSETGSVSAVWAHSDGSVTINGGHYSVGQDKDGKRNDCIYAGSNSTQTAGTITINGGLFEYTGTPSTEIAKDGDRYLLNCADSTPSSSVTVSAGKFKNHVPGLESTGEGVIVADWASVYYMDTYVPEGADANTVVTAAHDKSVATTWYEVR